MRTGDLFVPVNEGLAPGAVTRGLVHILKALTRLLPPLFKISPGPLRI